MIFLHSFNTFEVNLLKNERQMSNFLVLFFYLQKIIHGAKLKQNFLLQLLNSRGDHCVLSFENCILCNRTMRCLLLQLFGVSLNFPYVQFFVPLCEVGWKESSNKRKQVIVEKRLFLSVPPLLTTSAFEYTVCVLTQNSET